MSSEITRNISQHYDLPPEWFAAGNILNGYSCALWNYDTETYTQAVDNKIRKYIELLDLQPGETGCEFGFGHGYTAREFVRKTGCNIDALNIVPAEVAYLKQFESNSLKAYLSDWADWQGNYDFVYGDGSLVHAESPNQDGSKQRAYFQKAWDLLKPGGRALIKEMFFTSENPISIRECKNIKETFRVGEYTTLEKAVSLATDVGFEVETHNIPIWNYLLCLKDWVGHFEKNKDIMWNIDKDRWRLDFETYKYRFPMLLERGAFRVDILLCRRP